MRRLVVSVALLTLAACGGPSGPAVDRPRLIDEAHMALGLQITNQSFIDRSVELTVSVDGTQLVKQRFAVGSGHTVVRFRVHVAPGRHTVKAVSNTGVSVERVLETVPGTKRFVSLSYWNNDDFDANRVPHRIKRIDCDFFDAWALIS